MNTIGIDWNEVILLVIGALVGIGSSVAMIFIQNVNEKYGKMCIYTKFNCLKNMGREGWGIYDNPEGGLTFIIPIIFEIENTSKRARIMRDVNLVLMKENKGIAGIFPDKSSPCRVTLIIFPSGHDRFPSLVCTDRNSAAGYR